MSDNKVRMNLLSAFLKFALTINIVIMICGIVMLFHVNDTYGIYAAAICSVCALMNCIGLTLVLRWHHSGTVIITVSGLLSAITLSITCAGWLNYSFGTFGMYVPYIVFLVYVLLLGMLLLVKVNGKSAWQQMDTGLDMAHCRHIYQLSTVMVIAIVGIAYFEMPPSTYHEQADDSDIFLLDRDVTEARLDSPDITIEEVVSFEKNYNENNDVEDRDQRISKRIFALKHLLLSGLMPDIHSRDNLVNICMVHAGEFSEQQQEILDWYLALDVCQQEEWNVCEKANSLIEFKQRMLNKMK